MRIQPEGPVAVGGNCQGATIAQAVAAALRGMGRDVSPLILLDEYRFEPFDGRVAVMFGTDSIFNPYKPGADPDATFREAFPAGYSVDLLDAPHGAYFRPPGIDALCNVLQRLFCDASDIAWVARHANAQIRSPLGRLLPWRPRTPLAAEASWDTIHDRLRWLPFRIPTPDGFCEESYLAANPDVAEAYRRKRLRSAFEHYVKHGRRENRQRFLCALAPARDRE